MTLASLSWQATSLVGELLRPRIRYKTVGQEVNG
jgi:hypothetical protein